MKKRLLLLAIAGCITLCSACNKSGMATLNIHVDQFTITQTNISGEKSSAAEAVKRIDIAIFNETGNIVYSENQSIADSATFGTLSCTLHDGTYTIVVIGHKSSGPATITAPNLATFPNNSMSDIFCATQSITISGSYIYNTSISLNRVISMFGVRSTDAIPSNITNVMITLSSGGTSLNPTTGLSTSATPYTHSINIPANYIGRTNIKFLAPTLLITDESTTDVSVNALDATGTTIYTHSFSNIPLKRNRITLAAGPLFSALNEGTFTFNTTWMDTAYVNW